MKIMKRLLVLMLWCVCSAVFVLIVIYWPFEWIFTGNDNAHIYITNTLDFFDSLENKIL